MGFVGVYRMIMGWWSGRTAASRGTPVPAAFLALPGDDQFLADPGVRGFLSTEGD